MTAHRKIRRSPALAETFRTLRPSLGGAAFVSVMQPISIEPLADISTTLKAGLVRRTRRPGTHSATGFTRIDMAALSSTLRPSDVREGFLVWNVVGIDSIAEQVVILGASQYSSRGP